MRADRLLSILLLLQNHGRMTAHELATRLEVSERTIYRDLEALNIAGVPVYTERGPGGGCELLDGYQTRLTGLNENEVQALAILMKSAPTHLFAELGLGKSLDDALLKLQAALSPRARATTARMQQRMYLDDVTWPFLPLSDFRLPGQACVQIIQQALWQDRTLCLFYRDENECWHELPVDPYGLVAYHGTWFLVAAPVQDRPLCRVFRVARIHSATMLPETFVFPADFDLVQYWNEYRSQVEHVYMANPLPPPAVPSAPDLVNEPWTETIHNHPVAEQKVLPFRRKRARSVPRNKKNGLKKFYPSASQAGRAPYKKNVQASNPIKKTAPIINILIQKKSPSSQKKAKFLPLSRKKTSMWVQAGSNIKNVYGDLNAFNQTPIVRNIKIG